MIEIIPNWHPIFVHFFVGLFSASFAFYVFAYLSPFFKFFSVNTISEFEIVARWCLWVAGLVAIPTVIAGLYAYNTVSHDAISHAAMTNHRNWAIPTAIGIMLLALWSIGRYRKHKTVTIIFITAILLMQGMMLSTAWRGAELVFRYGLGVMSLPKSNGDHHHAEGMANVPEHAGTSETENHDHEH